MRMMLSAAQISVQNAAQDIDTLRGIKEASGNISVSHSEMLRAGIEWNIG